jgi:hypothetical protein
MPRDKKKSIVPAKQPVHFKVLGPYRLRVSKQKFGRCIEEATFKDFWLNHSGLAKQKGCYVFTMSKRPFYVGKATKNFRQEVFNLKNVNTYQSVLRSVHGKPCLYMVVLSDHKGKTPSSIISQVEKLLIGLAHEANPDLKNVHHKNKEDRFVIGGVYNSGRGKRPKEAKAFRSVLNLQRQR